MTTIESYLAGYITSRQINIIIEHLREVRPPSQVIRELLIAAAKRDQEKLLDYLFSRVEAKEYSWAEIKLPAEYWGSLLSRTSSHPHDLSDDQYYAMSATAENLLLNRAERCGLRLDGETLAKLYHKNLLVPSFIWLIRQGPARLPAHMVQTVMTRVGRSTSHSPDGRCQILQRFLSFNDEYPQKAWQVILEQLPQPHLSARQYHLAPRWLHSALAARGLQPPPHWEKAVIESKWCPQNAPLCRWPCSGRCRMDPEPGISEDEEYEPIMKQLLEGKMDNLMEQLLQLPQDIRDNIPRHIELIARQLYYRAISCPYTDPALDRAVTALVMLLDYDSHAVGVLNINLVCEVTLRLRYLPTKLLKAAFAGRNMFSGLWHYLGRRIWLLHRKLDVDQQLPAGLYLQLIKQERCMRTTLAAATSANLAGYVLTAV